MHMRVKKWAKPELDACGIYTDEPGIHKGQWKEQFPQAQPLHIELGCGKGVSTAQMTAANREINYLAVDIADNVLGDTLRNLKKAYGKAPIGNVRIVKGDIAYISEMIAPEDRVERIYIHFCNPWTKRSRHFKRRLTHPRQLMQYRGFLAPDAEIWFKTDDDELFRDSLRYFAVCNFTPVYLTHDLHASGFSPNYVSEHEQKFAAQGVPIKFGIFRMLPEKPDFDPVRWTEDRERAMARKNGETGDPADD